MKRSKLLNRRLSLLPLPILLVGSPTEILIAGEQKRAYRDPFRSLTTHTAQEPKKSSVERQTLHRPPGLQGVRIAEVTPAGVVSSGGTYLALLASEDHFLHIARIGSQLFDGVVLAISDQGILFEKSADTSATVYKPLRGESE